MPATLVPTALPSDVIKAVQRDLPIFKSLNPTLQNLLTEAAGSMGGERLQVFTLGIPDVLPGGKALQGAYPGGWRVAVDASGGTAADIYTVERVGPTPLPEGTARVACVRRGPEIARMLHAILLLRGPHPLPIPAEPFQLRLVSMPELFTEGLWLAPQSMNRNSVRVVPYYTLIKGFPVGIPYTEGDFIEMVRPVATAWQDMPVPYEDFPKKSPAQ